MLKLGMIYFTAIVAYHLLCVLFPQDGLVFVFPDCICLVLASIKWPHRPSVVSLFNDDQLGSVYFLNAIGMKKELVSKGSTEAAKGVFGWA